MGFHLRDLPRHHRQRRRSAPSLVYAAAAQQSMATAGDAVPWSVVATKRIRRPGAMDLRGTGCGNEGFRRACCWHLAALLVFAAGVSVLFRALWGQDPTAVVPANPQGMFTGDDLSFVVWLISRNASALLSAPWHLFDIEPCYPVEHALALGEPGVSLGVLATPVLALGGNPFLVFNVVSLALPLVAACAMYALVREWTGAPAAGIVAGCVYGLHPVKTWNVIHPYVQDSAWTVLALLFAQRLFAHHRWRDAIGLGLCAALQIGASFYPLISGAVIGVAFLVWLLLHHGVRRQRLPQLLLVAAMVATAAAFVYGPFLSLRAEGALSPRRWQAFAVWDAFLPALGGYLGWTIVLLLPLGLASPRRRALPGLGGDPRPALLVAALAIALLATGGGVYRAVASVIPGLDVVRVPRFVMGGVHLCASVLAGLGAAALLGWTPARWRALVACALVAIAWIDVVRPPLPGLPPRVPLQTFALAPDAPTLAFYRTLAASGNAGPLLEVPMDDQRAAGVLLSLWHRRRTSRCYGSYSPPVVEAVIRIAGRLPGRDAVLAAGELGFTTIVVRTRSLRKAFDAFARTPEGRVLRPVHRDGRRAAYEIRGVGATPPRR